MLRLTPVVKNLIIINVIVFLGGMFAPRADFSDCLGRGLESIRGMDRDVVTGFLSLWNVKTECFKPYQLFTYMFVHGGFMHLFFNMIGFAFIGPILESYWGQKKFTIFFLVTGIGAGIFNVLVDMFLNLGSFGTMVGASGALYGFLMGFGMLFPNMEVRLLFPPIPIKAKYLVVLLFGLTFVMDRSGSVAHFTHLGGVIFAFILIKAWGNSGSSHY